MPPPPTHPHPRSVPISRSIPRATSQVVSQCTSGLLTSSGAFLSCLVLSCLVSSCLVLSCLVLSCLHCLVLSFGLTPVPLFPFPPEGHQPSSDFTTRKPVCKWPANISIRCVIVCSCLVLSCLHCVFMVRMLGVEGSRLSGRSVE